MYFNPRDIQIKIYRVTTNRCILSGAICFETLKEARKYARTMVYHRPTIQNTTTRKYLVAIV
jgi:hypothetical protein